MSCVTVSVMWVPSMFLGATYITAVGWFDLLPVEWLNSLSLIFGGFAYGLTFMEWAEQKRRSQRAHESR